MFKRILVAVDGSPASARALETAVDLAVGQHAMLIALHVVDELSMKCVPFNSVVAEHYVDALRAEGRRILGRAERHARTRGIGYETVMTDVDGETVAHEILAQARLLHADVIVVGTHGRRGLRRLVMGSDAEAVLREAQLPVLVVRGGARAPRTSVRQARPSKARSPRVVAAPSIASAR